MFNLERLHTCLEVPNVSSCHVSHGVSILSFVTQNAVNVENDRRSLLLLIQFYFYFTKFFCSLLLQSLNLLNLSILLLEHPPRN